MESKIYYGNWYTGKQVGRFEHWIVIDKGVIDPKGRYEGIFSDVIHFIYKDVKIDKFDSGLRTVIQNSLAYFHRLDGPATIFYDHDNNIVKEYWWIYNKQIPTPDMKLPLSFEDQVTLKLMYGGE